MQLSNLDGIFLPTLRLKFVAQFSPENLKFVAQFSPENLKFVAQLSPENLFEIELYE